MHLTDLSPNERACIVAIEGGCSTHRHLALRGLACGCTITMLSGRFGPVVVRIGGGTLVLGRGTAQKIQVRKV